MAKAGRKRKQGRRHPNGQLVGETQWQVMEPVLRRRCRELGLPETVENMRLVKGQEGGTAWGRLYLAEYLNRRQYEAADWFASKRAQYLRSIDAPKEHPKICNMSGEATGGAYSGESPESVRRIEIEYLGAERRLTAAGRAYLLAMQALAREECDHIPLHIIQRALTILADHAIAGEKQVA